MWATFFIAGLLGIALLYIPGSLITAGAGCHISIFAAAPAISLLLYSILAIVYSIVGVPSGPFSLILGCLLISLIVFAVLKASLRRQKNSLVEASPAVRKPLISTNILVPLSYLFLGTAITLYIYVKCMNGADSFIQTYDNVFHINLVRNLMDSSDWSPLHSNLFPVSLDNSIDPFPGYSYYPSAWHILCALVASITSSSATLATNAINSVFAGVVFPLSIYSLMTQIFSKDQSVVFFGSIITLAFVSYPWVLLMLWPLFPNAVSLALLPGLIALFINLFSDDLNLRQRVSTGVIFIISVTSFAFIQPNSVFSAAVFLIPFCISKIKTINLSHYARKSVGKRSLPHIPRLNNLLILLFMAGCAVIWVVCFNLPFMQGTVQYYWPPLGSPSQQLFNILTLSFAGAKPQPFLASLVFIGSMYCMYSRKHCWIVGSYAFSCLIYFVSATCNDTLFKHLLSGFWYTDPYRTAAMAAIFAIPLAALGLSAVSKIANSIARLVAKPNKYTNLMTTGLISCLTLLIVFYPSYYTSPSNDAAFITPFDTIRKASLVQNNGSDSNAYDDEERAFVQKVMGIVPEDELIINMPYDGSLYAYGYEGINELYRSISGYGTDGESKASTVIRTSLCNISHDQTVRDYVKDLGATHVLILERDTERMGIFFPTFAEGEWDGILGITDDTPGFEVVLSQGDMRLYRIAN